MALPSRRQRPNTPLQHQPRRGDLSGLPSVQSLPGKCPRDDQQNHTPKPRPTLPASCSVNTKKRYGLRGASCKLCPKRERLSLRWTDCRSTVRTVRALGQITTTKNQNHAHRQNRHRAKVSLNSFKTATVRTLASRMQRPNNRANALPNDPQ